VADRGDVAAVPHGDRHIAQVQQVEADDEQVVDRLGEPGVAEDVLQEHQPVARQRARHPDGQPDADRQVSEVHPDLGTHPAPLSNTFNSIALTVDAILNAFKVIRGTKIGVSEPDVQSRCTIRPKTPILEGRGAKR